VGPKEKMNSIGQPVPELPVALGFEIGWLYPCKEIGAVSRGNVAIFFRKRKPPFEPAVHWVFAEYGQSPIRKLVRSRGGSGCARSEQSRAFVEVQRTARCWYFSFWRAANYKRSLRICTTSRRP
jgi:hypothetical protein